MVQDLIDHRILVGKSGIDVKQLLGQPDHETTSKSSPRLSRDPGSKSQPLPDWYGYDVITIGRCRVWRCFVNVNFNPESHVVESVAVSD